MVQVLFTDYFVEEIKKKFSEAEGNKILDLLETLEENPYKGKELCHVGKILLKEMRYEKFRFYFITDGYKLKFLKSEELKNLLIKFVRMSEKKDQQKVISEIKNVLLSLGEEEF
ncbi:MAG: hypothetical protein WCV90_08200 [Candidatus Woesearchaeota archaeon]|jgi:mRNA-degrading endonuclease RelE of RelBE toxin-antitoxin system